MVGQHTLQRPHDVDLILRPCVAELLRTHYYPPKLVLRIEMIQIVDVRSKQAYNIYLSDGELMFQAILHRSLYPFIITKEVEEGSLVILEKYELEKGMRLNEKGEVM